MWKIEFTNNAIKEFSILQVHIKKYIQKAIDEKLSINPDYYLIRLSGDKRDFHKFRI